MVKKILLTGATGFLGKNIMERLIREGIPYVATSLHGDKSFNVVALNLTDTFAVNKFIAQNEFSAIFHIGAFVNLSRDYETANRCVKDNLLGTLNLLESCKEINNLKFIFASTEEIYGDNTIPFKESQEPKPPSPYSISKVAAENFISYYSNSFGFSSYIFRIGTMYGPYMPKNKFISKLIIQAANSLPVLINSGKKKRDYIYVEDVVDAFMLALKKKTNTRVSVLNIGGRRNIRLDDFAQKIIRYSGHPSILEYNSIEERASESSEWLMDISKSKEVLGWSPKTTVDKGLQKTLVFYENNKPF